MYPRSRSVVSDRSALPTVAFPPLRDTLGRDRGSTTTLPGEVTQQQLRGLLAALVSALCL